MKLSDAKEWALRMKEKGYGFKTINNHKRSLKAAFYTAIQDDCIRKNPFDFQLNTVLEDDTEPKEPLSPTQEAAFLSFVQHDKSLSEILRRDYHTVRDRASHFGTLRTDGS